MKKLLFGFVIITLAAFFYFWHMGAPQTAENIPTPTGTSFHPDASSGAFTIDGDKITLSKGVSIRNEGDGLTTETKLLDEQALGDINADGKEDVVVILSQYAGGSGTFIYAAAYVSGPVSYKGTEAIFLGDRIAPQSVSISNGVATVKYLDRKEDEPFAAEPTISVSKQFIFKSGAFVEK